MPALGTDLTLRLCQEMTKVLYGPPHGLVGLQWRSLATTDAKPYSKFGGCQPLNVVKASGGRRAHGNKYISYLHIDIDYC